MSKKRKDNPCLNCPLGGHPGSTFIQQLKDISDKYKKKEALEPVTKAWDGARVIRGEDEAEKGGEA